LDKYELIEVLRAAADGIAGVSKSKEAELKLDDFRRIVYNFCKFVIAQEELGSPVPSFSSSDPFGNPDPLNKFYSCVGRFNQTVSKSSFGGKELLNKVNQLYKQLTNEDPPKED
jgi:hypothetical protein